MTNVWYMGTASERRITVADWVAAGVTGVTQDSVWNATNGYALPLTQFTTAQRTVLAADGLFWLTAPDTGRPTTTIQAPSDPLPQYVMDAEIFDNTGRILLSRLPDSIPTSGGGGDVTTAALNAAVGAASTEDRKRSNHSGVQPVTSLDTTGTRDGTKFLRDDGAWTLPDAAASVHTHTVSQITDMAAHDRATDCLIFRNETAGTYPTRSSVNPDTLRRTRWVGSVAPALGGNYAIGGFDVFEQIV